VFTKPVTFRSLDNQAIGEIINLVMNQKWSYAQVGAKYNVTRFLIGKVIKNVKTDANYLDLLITRKNIE
jgi:hypothetical protein